MYRLSTVHSITDGLTDRHADRLTEKHGKS